MSDPAPIKVLIVDDLPEKLLVYRSVLEAPDLELVMAHSGSDALRHVLQHDFAVILLDINMPDLDGYETAAMIRTRKRCAHTPIIFITAYADELHTGQFQVPRGYSYGAVDYILAPVVPEVLRTKVRVFVDLYRLNQQVRDQAARQVARAERERARVTEVLESASDLVAQTDAQGEVIHINPAGRKMLGYAEGDCLPLRLAGLSPGDPRLEAAVRDGMWFGEATLQTRGGHDIPVSQLVLAHKDEVGQIESISVVAQDIAERKRAEQAKARLAAIVESSDDAIISKTIDGVITSWNQGAQRLFGYSPEETVGQPVIMLIPEDRLDEEQMILGRIRAGEHVAHYETVRRTKDGRLLDVSLTISPILDSQGRVIGASKVAHDITARKRVEAELVDHRARLEQLVHERTAELEASHERLRLADRLASIGTLAAGLGHDMGNLLLPIRARLASLEQGLEKWGSGSGSGAGSGGGGGASSAANLRNQAREDVQAIKTAGEYLKRLSQGLRLFALDPTENLAAASGTTLSGWWADVQPFLRNALPRGVTLEATIPPELPPIAIAPHTFTQVIYNLVQNAGDAMRERGSGTVAIKASCRDLDARSDSVLISVSDNGPGMTDEVRLRCMEPFFTTRTRRISTGLGLALVRGAIGSAGGTIEIESQVGVGTTFFMRLPVALGAGSADDAAKPPQLAACIAFKDRRLAAYVASLLRNLNVEVLAGVGANAGAVGGGGEAPQWSADTPAHLLVLDTVNGCAEELERFLSADATRRALVIAPADSAPLPAGPSRLHERIAWLEGSPTPARLRSALGALHSSALQSAAQPLSQPPRATEEAHA